ncbi:cytochrome P450 [Bailinhaonella thermotolerans]|uniref:Cytochrome P450 n=1 Tax=Bailinhaonella thermotolerans TaxID=1070861 RepID=A0A3A4B7Y8_9ACTN|nr:cytochrome P450 [Bailinhaonella thermotolerans]RJL34351.1 cytochrome P450 [Bailinhaonella thermotolerans]
MTATPETMFNPFEPGFTDDPYPAYSRLREADPVQEHPLGFWILSRYEDAAEALRAGLSVDEGRIRTGPLAEVRDRLRSQDQGTLTLSMLDRDPPDHTRLRSLVSRVFTPRRIAALEPEIARLVDGYLDEIEEAGRADLVTSLAFPLPFAVISRMLGTDPAEHAAIRDMSGTLVRALEPVFEEEVLDAIDRARAGLDAVARELIARKRAEPADDLLSALIAAEEDGDVLSDDELAAQVVLLYVAGHETTVNLIAGGTVALLRNPGQLALLRAHPELGANAVEELLRYDSPVQQTRRVTVEPYAVGGRVIPPDSFVSVVLASANRDESFWGPDADRLRLDRPDARRHLSFGGGPHFCLGAHLARLEGRVALTRLTSRFPGLALDGEVTWNGRINLRGPATVPITTG